MADIFLSYNRQDQAVARLYAEAFERAGLTVWWDVTLRSGETYDTVTEEALRTAAAVVVLWSPRSVVSRWVRAEATIADRLKTFIPVTIEPCERPIMFELTQTAEMSHWQGDERDDAWKALVDDVRRHIANRTAPENQAATGIDPATPSAKPDELTAIAVSKPNKKLRGSRPTLAVIPFTNRSNEPDDEDFADAVVEDITSSLSQGRGLRVLAHSVMEQYRGKTIDVRKIGHDHGADYVLEGNLRRLGRKVRIAAQLVDGHTGAILWTEKFDRPTDELFDLLDELVDDVIAHLHVEIQRIELTRAQRKPKAENASDALKRCWAEIPRMSIPSLEKAVGHARRAVEFDPDSALVRSTLGLVLGLLYQRDGSRRPELLEEALEHCDRALHLGGRVWQVLFQVSIVKYYAQDWDESLQLSERAVELNPKSADALQALAGAYTRIERYEEALEILDRADQLAPHGYNFTISLINRCWALYGLDRIDEGVETATEILKIMPSDHTGLMLRPLFHAERGDWDLACKDIAELRRAYPDEPLDLFLGTIRTSRQTDAKRERNAELFEQAWKMHEEREKSKVALSHAGK
uniref:TIR domain-containing protein n=1 Tax=Parerythrobacter lutipelagi TaxID=1964208 RepID=UPI00137551EF|nr:TIR domain-containing protein [Parerythrobacter lutipelagi]